MHYLVSGKEMKLLDRNTSVHFGVPELVLMEQAAMTFVWKFFELQRTYKKACNRILIVCGSGNNGADGLAVARLLYQKGKDVTIYTIGELAGHRTSNFYNTQKTINEAYQIPMVTELPDKSFDVIIDAIFGIGLSRDIIGSLAEGIRKLNERSSWKLAVDISSGIDSDCGAILGTSFLAEDTITFSYGKLGQYLWPGNEASGRVHVVPIGITEDSRLEGMPEYAVLDKNDLKRLPVRKDHSNKGSYGKLLVIAGSKNMAGAAVFSGTAAYRSGTGLVRILTDEANRQTIQTAVPEAVLITYNDGFEEKLLLDQLQWADAVVLGPGIGLETSAKRLVEITLKHYEGPLIIDADGLNIVSKNPEWLLYKKHVVVTPHLGEMSRLTGETVADIQKNMIKAAKDFAEKYNVICVLKDFRTITAVPHGLTYFNMSGNNGMATAGSGDVLAGMIGALLAQGLSEEDAAAFGVFLHGLAGDAAKDRYSATSMMASDILWGITRVFNRNPIESE